MTITLRDLLNDGKVHVLDGAMGTMLYSKGFFLNVCYDELSRKQPKLVQEVHEAYVRAGAEILETNTFGANPVKLRSYGLADDTEQINQAAAELARNAAAGHASVVGAIGPLGVRIEPFGALAREEACAHFARQVDGLLAGGVDGFILETFSDTDEIHAALRAVRSRSDLPVIAQMTIGDDGLTHYRTGPGRDRRELLGGARRGARGGREDGEGDRPSHLGRAQRGAATRRGRPQDLSRLPRVHGELRAADDRSRRPPRRRLLRYHARTHQEDPRLRGERRAPAPAGGGVPGGDPRARRCGGGAVGAALALGRQNRARRARDLGRDRPAQGGGRDPDARAVPRAQGGRRGRRERPRRPAGPEPHGRAPVRDPDRARGGHRDGDPLLLPGPQPARHALRYSRRPRCGAAQHSHHYRGPAQDGSLP